VQHHTDHIQFAGDYKLDAIVLHNHQNEGIDPADQGIDITPLVIEMNIYEGIEKTSITGSLVITDSNNLIAKLPIQGTERISFKLSTPGAHEEAHVVDCSERTGHPMHVYKVSDRRQLNEGTQSYVLHFCSRELLRNLRTRVSESFSGRIDQMVYKILGDPDYLDSRKRLFFQKTRNQDKITIPNKRPFDAINMLSLRALADDSKGAGYYFYQTTKGFHFRSFESMCVDSRGNPRQIKQEFNFMPMNNNDPKITGSRTMNEEEVDKVTHDYTSVESYTFNNTSHDVALNQMVGTYGHRVITHNLYDKSYKESDFHYHNYYNDTKHVDGPNPAVVGTPVDYDDKGVSDYPESRVSVMPTTRFAHGEDTGSFGIDAEQDGIITAARVSQNNAVTSGTNLKLTVKGQSYLEPGDVIKFNILSVENKQDSQGALDPQFAGRYIISKIRHRVAGGEYIQVLECVKDSVFRPYRSDGEKSYKAKQLPYEKGPSDDIAGLDSIGTMDGY
jgi:hypothetical protein